MSSGDQHSKTRKDFNPYGTTIGARRPKPSSDDSTSEDKDSPTKNINWPVIGAITEIYFTDDLNNRSKNLRHGPKQGLTQQDLEGYLQQLRYGVAESGTTIECDVRVIYGLSSESGFTDQPLLENVPLCLSFGGVHDFGQIIPKARNNMSTPYETNTGDGDWVIVQFVGGNVSQAIITGFYPHPCSVGDAAKIRDGSFAKFRFNGVSFKVDRIGNVIFDSREAGQITTVDPNTGAFVRSKTDGSAGSISVISKNDIAISAGTQLQAGEEGSLPKGHLALKASKDVNVISTLKDINLDTVDDSNKIKMQNMHGNAKPVARKGDRIKITDGHSGNLFKYISSQRRYLQAVGADLVAQGAVASGLLVVPNPVNNAAAIEVLAASLITAGGILSSLTEFMPPSHAEGQIIEGSSLVLVGAKPEDSQFSTKDNFDALSIIDGLFPGALIKEVIFAKCIGEVTAIIQANQLGFPDVDIQGILDKIEAVKNSTIDSAKLSGELSGIDDDLKTLENDQEDTDLEDFHKNFGNDNVDPQTKQGLLDRKDEIEEDLAAVKETIDDAKAELAEAEAELKEIIGSPEVQFIIDLGIVTDTLLDDTLSLIEKIEKIAVIFGAEESIFLLFNDCLENSLSDALGVIAAAGGALSIDEIKGSLEKAGVAQSQVNTMINFMGDLGFN